MNNIILISWEVVRSGLGIFDLALVFEDSQVSLQRVWALLHPEAVRSVVCKIGWTVGPRLEVRFKGNRL